MSRKCIINCTIFHGEEKVVHKNIANTIFDNFVVAFAWLENFLDERNGEFEIEEYRRAGFIDETIERSTWDEEHNYWYTEIYDCEIV